VNGKETVNSFFFKERASYGGKRVQWAHLRGVNISLKTNNTQLRERGGQCCELIQKAGLHRKTIPGKKRKIHSMTLRKKEE